MEIIVRRTYHEKATTGLGEVIEDGKVIFSFFTLELPWNNNERNISCIPEGEYLVRKMPPNSKRRYEYFWVQDVPGRDSILWHPGNYTSQILGCCLPGEKLTDINRDGIIDITNTTATLKRLTDLMPTLFKLKIVKA